MRRTAGAEIRAFDADDADRRNEPLRMLAQRQSGNVRLVFIKRRMDGQVLPDKTVGELLRFNDLLVRYGLVKVDGRVVQREVEADVARRKQFVKRKRQQVLACVLLHEVESACPVDPAGYDGADRKRAIHAMNDFAAFLAHMGDKRLTQRAGIGGLASAFRKEHGLIEHNVKRISRGNAGDDAGFSLGLVAVLVIQTLCHSLPSYEFRASSLCHLKIVK